MAGKWVKLCSRPFVTMAVEDYNKFRRGMRKDLDLRYQYRTVYDVSLYYGYWVVEAYVEDAPKRDTKGGPISRARSGRANRRVETGASGVTGRR